MPGPVPAAEVVIGLLTENTQVMLTQAIRLLRSLRWFGGQLAGARVIVCGIGELAAEASATLRDLGAEIRTVTRFHPANPTANRHQLLAELLKEPEEILFLLDCDVIVVRDPLPWLGAEGFQAKPAPTPTVTDEVFDRLFAHFGLVKPPRSRVAPFTGTPMIPYFNGGVLVIPRSVGRTLAPVWRKYNQILADQPELVAPCQRHMHQASLSLALAETGLPSVDLPEGMNFQLNATHLTPPPGFAETDPAIIHYHHLATSDGFLLPCPYPRAQARIDLFHDRMRAEGFEPATRLPEGRASRPLVVLGMHRSGTSVVAGLLHSMGAYAGTPDELIPADMFNPTGFWERRDVVELNSRILESLGASWIDTIRADVSRVSDEMRGEFAVRARALVRESLEGRGAYLIKDPRMSLLFTLWREVLPDPVCIVVWREPMAVAQSLKTRDNRPRLASLAGWEHHTRTLLRDTEGMPRVLVSYEALLDDPVRVARELHASLTDFGVPGLSVVPEERVRQFVNADFNRSGRKAAEDESLLDETQRALVADLRSGAALSRPVAPAPARALELLAEFGEIVERDREADRLRDQIRERDLLLTAIFESRTWRIGHRLTGLLRLLRRQNALTAEDRWRKQHPVH